MRICITRLVLLAQAEDFHRHHWHLSAPHHHPDYHHLPDPDPDPHPHPSHLELIFLTGGGLERRIFREVL